VTINYTIKPAEPYKKTIPPSSLYKGRCPRCTWMNFWHNFKIPVNMNLQQNLSRKQEKFFDGCPTTTLDASLRPGKISLLKGKKRSSLITINGQLTRWAFYGELDFGVNYDDGGFGVADGKVSLKDDPDELVDSYTTQLHAYAFMLEYPDSGTSQKIPLILLKVRNGVSELRLGTSPLREKIKGFLLLWRNSLVTLRANFLNQTQSVTTVNG
jgi:hypothetical protein